MEKRDLLTIVMLVFLAFAGIDIVSLEQDQKEIKEELDRIGDQQALAEIHRSYTPTSSAQITAEVDKKLEQDADQLDTKVSIGVDEGEFDLHEVRVTAYDLFNDEIYSTDKNPERTVDVNHSADLSFRIPLQVEKEYQKLSARLIKVEAVDETAYIQEDGSFDYGTSDEDRDVGARNPSQLFLVNENCVDEIEGLEDVCFHTLEPLKSYEVDKNMKDGDTSE